MPVSLGLGGLYVATNNATINGAGNDTIIAGNNDTIMLASGGNSVTAGNNDTITIAGGGNYVSLKNYGALTINDARSIGDSYSGTVTFADSIWAKDYNS